MDLLRGRWFDGRSTQPRPVLVSLRQAPEGPTLVLHPLAADGEPRRFAHGQVGWPQAWNPARAQRAVVVDLRDHGSLEVDDSAAWHAALAATGARVPLAQRMQTRWPVFLAVLVAVVLALGAFYRWGTPWAATQLTRHVPTPWETSLAERAMQQLDDGYLKPSKLPPERQAALRAGFDSLAVAIGPGLRRYPGYAPRLALTFRSGMGANAFALPGGTVVMTDGLVQAAAKAGLGDDALLGVLAHEIGHVMHRHTTRMVVEQGVLNVGLGLAMGDVSTVVSMGASLLTGLSYRRSHETEADCFAMVLMRQAGRPVAPMGRLLLDISGEQDGQASRADGVLELLNSHPDTRQRAQRFAAGQTPGC